MILKIRSAVLYGLSTDLKVHLLSLVFMGDVQAISQALIFIYDRG